MDEAHPLSFAQAVQAKYAPEPPTDIGALEAGFRPASSVFADDALLERMLAYQASFTPDLDRKGQAAYFITEYAMMFAVTAVVPFVGAGLVPDLAADTYGIALAARPVEHEGRQLVRLVPSVRFASSHFVTAGQQWANHPDATLVAGDDELCERLRQATEAHFAPLVERLHALTRLPAQALWRLVGDSIAAVFLESGRRFGREGEACAQALKVLKAPSSPLNNAQMHYFEIAVREPPVDGPILLRRTFRARGGCCRYYRTKGGSLCSTCVLHRQEERDRNLQNGMRKRLGLAPLPLPAT